MGKFTHSRLLYPFLGSFQNPYKISVIKGQKPITIGHGYSTLGVVPEASGSWFLPLLHERIPSETAPSVKLAQQLKTVCAELSARPLGLFDSEYGSGRARNAGRGV